MSSARREDAAYRAMVRAADMSGLPTVQPEARPNAPPQAASDFAASASPSPFPHHLTLGVPATNNNAYNFGRSSFLALDNNWQPEDDNASTAQHQHPLPLPIVTSNAAVGVLSSTAQPTLYVGVPAASSPQSWYKYCSNDFTRSLLETTQTSYPMPERLETMQTPPVSAHPSPNDTAMGDQQTRKRSHSVMSASQDFTQQMIAAATASSAGHQNDLQPRSRSGSVESIGGEVDGYSPRGSRSFKRGDPPKNEHGKYICNYSEDCREAKFDRKCEWSKHMDKHDRPYRCPHQLCGKLQGFTYSGGLLRHEREVHGKHGGPKAQLMCPHSDCKRHLGKGFTRKENLNEHLRRVHFGKDPDSQDVGLGADDDEADVDSATQEAHAVLTSSTSHKRKRSSNNTEFASELSIMKQQIAQLRAENDQKDAIIQDLTQQLAQNHQQHHEQAMHESISGFQQN